MTPAEKIQTTLVRGICSSQLMCVLPALLKLNRGLRSKIHVVVSFFPSGWALCIITTSTSSRKNLLALMVFLECAKTQHTLYLHATPSNLICFLFDFEALEEFWNSVRDTDWFKQHPVLSSSDPRLDFHAYYFECIDLTPTLLILELWGMWPFENNTFGGSRGWRWIS